MNFLLKNLEHELNDQHLLVGEKLFEDGRVAKLFENEHHLWIANVDGLEVEMQISPSRVKACSCECGVFEKERMCGHVAAGLFALRKQLSETVRQPRQNQRTKSFSYQKLTINAILDSVTQEELAAFVRNFARTNKVFSLALRAKFAAKVALADNQEKFGQLLDTAIQSYRKTNDRIGAIGVKQLEKLLVELLGQADDAIALEHFAEAWSMLSAIVSRFASILKKLESDDSSLASQVEQAFEKIGLLVSLAIPPDLKEEIVHFCAAEFNRPAYRLNAFSGCLLNSWLILASDEESARALLLAIDNELKRPMSNIDFRNHLILVKLQIIQRSSFSAENEAFTLECLSDPKTFISVVEAVESTGDYRGIKSLVEKGRRFIQDEDLKNKLEVILLQIAQTEGETDVVASISRQKFLETLDFRYYDQCRQNHQGDWESFVKQLLADLVARYDFRQNIPTIATILGREEKLDELLGILSDQQSIEMLIQFDHFLLKKKTVEVRLLYEKLLKGYLSEHFGLQASKYLRNILEHLHQSGAGALAEQLFISIQAAFPKRRFYLEEMEEA